MTVQTTFAAQKLGISGALNGVQANTVHSYINEEASAIPMGFAVVRGTAADGLTDNALLPSAASQDLLGIVLRTMEHDDSAANEVAPGEVLNALVSGSMFVLPEVDVAAGDDVFFNHTGGNEGQLRNDNDGGNADQILRARWESASDIANNVPAILTLEGVANNA